ncbi:MAG: DUF559 domain-containing protein [bacterium]|nr:DUF559 domain-containing protein [bacterium]
MDTPRGGAGFSGYCVRVFEVDGPCHARQRSADARRDRALGNLGWRVVRVSAEEVCRDVGAVVARAKEVLEDHR